MESDTTVEPLNGETDIPDKTHFLPYKIIG